MKMVRKVIPLRWWNFLHSAFIRTSNMRRLSTVFFSLESGISFKLKSAKNSHKGKKTES